MAREIDDELEQQTGAPSNRAMRRYQKREEKRQTGRGPARERRRPAPPPTRERTSPSEFMREVRGEMRKVAWPGRSEVFVSTVVVLIAVTVLTSLIFGFDLAFGEFVLYLYE